MLFTSATFILVFLPITLIVFLLIPAHCRAARKIWLTTASLFFYGYWNLNYVLLLLTSIGFNFAIAEYIVLWHGQRKAHHSLLFGIAANLLLLCYYKYTNFIAGIFGAALGTDFGHFDIVLPLAMSFFTFTQVGYIVDVARDPKLHYKFLDYSLFVVFFPHLVAGPIVRHWEMIPQYAEKDLRANREDFAVGSAIFSIGLLKKLLLADSAAVYANLIYRSAEDRGQLDWFGSWFGTLSYAMQIYFDFSGYSDMAIGLARMFSIKFPFNFDSPYKATSISDFWKKWHVTLTRFLREYVYFTLGGNRKGEFRQTINVMTTFLLSGLWHGAGWNFVIWGALHGVYLAVSQLWSRIRKTHDWRLTHWSYTAACVLLTFTCVLVSYVYFRAPNLKTANTILLTMFGGTGFTVADSITNASHFWGRIAAGAGVVFVPDTSGIQDYRLALRIVFGLLLVAWFMPNTQQLLKNHDPIFEPDIRSTRWAIPLNRTSGFILGVLLFIAVFCHFKAPSTPFLYFNF